MNNNLPLKEDNSIWKRISNFFRKLFFKKKMENQTINSIPENKPEKIETSKNEEKQRSFDESIKVDVKPTRYVDDKKVEDFLDKFERNPELLYDLPVEKLERLEKVYNESIKKKEMKLAKLKKEA